MKHILLIALTLLTLQAQSFSKQSLLGTWEYSSIRLNSFVAFGNYIGTQRGEIIKLVFNRQGRVKVLPVGDVYNYEVINGELKFYETKVYKGGYKVKRKNRYDLLKIVGNVEGCKEIKVLKKKIPVYKSGRNYKMCKVGEYPKPTYSESVSKYEF